MEKIFFKKSYFSFFYIKCKKKITHTILHSELHFFMNLLQIKTRPLYNKKIKISRSRKISQLNRGQRSASFAKQRQTFNQTIGLSHRKDKSSQWMVDAGGRTSKNNPRTLPSSNILSFQLSARPADEINQNRDSLSSRSPRIYPLKSPWRPSISFLNLG